MVEKREKELENIANNSIAASLTAIIFSFLLLFIPIVYFVYLIAGVAIMGIAQGLKASKSIIKKIKIRAAIGIILGVLSLVIIALTIIISIINSRK